MENKRIPREGERFGKLTVIRTEKLPCCNYVRIICKCDCGTKVTRTESTIRKTDRQLCDKCKKRETGRDTDIVLRKTGKEGPDRPFTNDTEWLICLWSSEGDSVAEIASTLRRNCKVIEETVKRCKKNGKYDIYARKSIRNTNDAYVRECYVNGQRQGKIKYRFAKCISSKITDRRTS